MSNFGVHSGQLKAKNIQTQTVDITTDASGDGSATITFKRSCKNVPVILAMAQEADTTGTLSASSITVSGCTLSVDGSSVVSGTLTVGVLIIDQPN